VAGNKSIEESIKTLIGDLISQDDLVRVKARKQLVAYRSRSVAPLVNELSSKNGQMRWEAAKALSQIGSPASTDALIKALEDPIFDVRWLAAAGLTKIGRKTIVPILEALEARPDSRWLLDGIHHILHDMNKGNLSALLKPVMAAMEGPEPSLEVPLKAREALKSMGKRA
jgi:HEAT repeat protein